MDLINQLAEQGVVALILAISIVGNYFLYKEVRSLQEKRVQDAKESRDQFLEPLKAIKQTVDLILTLLEVGSAVKHRK